MRCEHGEGKHNVPECFIGIQSLSIHIVPLLEFLIPEGIELFPCKITTRDSILLHHGTQNPC